eukprot:TRINITY_DN2346_c0_g1_i2.p1 TRINITY_DN2346_c0_g1~~TRINITY_DN2346_c0_g1_i2.p1  ORF type:complete len:174 (+),score=0.67 TRINITY_DN2346_c0_g1_i2:224-745(+)
MFPSLGETRNNVDDLPSYLRSREIIPQSFVSSLYYLLGVYIVYMYFLSRSAFTLLLRAFQFGVLYGNVQRDITKGFLYTFVLISNFPIVIWHLLSSLSANAKSTPLIITFIGAEETASVWSVMFVDVVIFTVESMLVYAYRNQTNATTQPSDSSLGSLLLLLGLSHSRNSEYV